MELWEVLSRSMFELQKACARQKTFLWLCVFLFALLTRNGDMAGVTSAVRVIGLVPLAYDRLLDFLHSPSLCLSLLLQSWVSLVVRLFPEPVLVNGRYVVVGDGIKAPKEGKKMPGVKSLHQESESNSKAEYIMGHSCQAVALLVHAAQSVFAVPLACRIHEGVVFSNRDSRTLLDKMLALLQLIVLPSHFYFVADAYYASRKIIHGMLNGGNHLISRVKSNAVAYYPMSVVPGNRHRGRPQKYARKIKLKTLFDDSSAFETIKSPVYGEKGSIQFRAIRLLWRHAGVMACFVFVKHPRRGRIMLISTDLQLSPVEIIRLYGLRFKIEVSFKQAVHVLGTFSYHFWMKAMKPIRRFSGDQYVHRESQHYRECVQRKLDAYHRYMQIGIIAQGLLQYLSCTKTATVWKKFGSWFRTFRPGIPPSERVVSIALKNCLSEFLADCHFNPNFKKFLREKLDLSRPEGLRLSG